MFHYCLHKNPQLVPIVTQINPARTSYFCKIRFNFILTSTSRYLRCLFPSCFSTKTLYALFFLMCATYPAFRIVLDYIILIVFGEEYMLKSSSLCSFLYPHIISSFLGPDNHPSIYFTNTLSLYSVFS